MNDRTFLLLCLAPLLLQNYLLLLEGPSASQSDLSSIFNAIELLQNVASVVETCPHSFRTYTSPWWVAPRPTDLFNNFVLDAWPENVFRDNFRMTRSSFQTLCNALRPKLTRQDTRWRLAIGVEQQVAVGLYYMAQGCSLRVLENTFAVARSTACKILHRFSAAVGDVFKHLVHFPSQERVNSMMDEFAVDGMPGCFGSIDGTHFPIRRPQGIPYYEDYYCVRYGRFTINAQALCDRHCYFYDVVCAYPGAAHDARILSESWLYEEAEAGALFDVGETVWMDERGTELLTTSPYIIGDSGYPLCLWLLTPYPDYAANTDARRFFNSVLRMARNCVERAFGMLKNRFRVFLTNMEMSPRHAVQMAFAGFLLHNWLLRQADAENLIVMEAVKRAEEVREAAAVDGAAGRANEKKKADGKREQLAQSMFAHKDALLAGRRGLQRMRQQRLRQTIQANARAMMANAHQ